MTADKVVEWQLELQRSQAQYYDLYDLAPVGYITLSEQGLILQANLTAAALLGVPRGQLVQQFLSRFIVPEVAHCNPKRQRGRAAVPR
ncbi:MAG: PAS domain-containing protein [Planctomycetota bacterium]|nr:PAS domain-containing protein [Planctomycetota bacterium]